MVDFGGEAPVVTDGPYGETKELFEGFFLLDTVSKQELVELPPAAERRERLDLSPTQLAPATWVRLEQVSIWGFSPCLPKGRPRQCGCV
ncbi:hypothetical protein Msi02_53510 [Microbispora siamensis]|uniref:YCII-related domain-containing protein n=1 Tax=Microbispora siamensis TaxID=564413 RepID=A0ABQ4GSW5_9ACTN|nr:hypothetical protein Msi02_53510 [Microbispora siamensis]